MKAVKPVAFKYKLGEQPEYRAATPEEGIRELEEIRRMFIDVTGDPDEPIQKVITKRTPPWK